MNRKRIVMTVLLLDWTGLSMACDRNNYSRYADLLIREVEELELDLAVGLTAAGLH
jgi:hypothetical protein